VFVENFTINGQTGDPRTLPGFPEEWKPYFGPGKGGVMTSDTVRADPRCVAKAEHAPAPGPYMCTDQKGRVGKGVGPLILGMTRREAETALGPPSRTTGPVLRWCLTDGGKLEGGFRADKLEFALTTSTAFDWRGLRAGAKRAAVGKRPKLMQRGGVAVYARGTVLIGADRNRVRWLATTKPGLSKKTIEAWLDNAR
jgi:hypothetical protein